MTIIQVYEQAVLKGDIEDNPSQRLVLEQLQVLADELLAPRRSWFSRGRGSKTMGIYLHGPVGVGKTYLIDLFYQSLSYQKKARFHFHQFMQQVDAQLRRLQGKKNPLQQIAADFARTTRLLCLDEFLVHDVAHAMILAELLKALNANGVVLVMTSNTRPDDLYLNGVQRARFLPAIALIKQTCHVMMLEHKKDYRLGREPLLEAYLYPLGAKTDKRMKEQFEKLALAPEDDESLMVQHREIACISHADRLVWFDFSVLCNLPRSQLDYLEIADRFDTVFLSNIPVLTEKDTVHVILLIQLVDVMYDRGIRLLLSAADSLEKLYVKGEMSQAFRRTSSRLQEMQSVDYLRRHPLRLGEHFN